MHEYGNCYLTPDKYQFQAKLFRLNILNVPVIAKAVIVTKADASIAAWGLGFLCCSNHSRGESWAHKRDLPPFWSLILKGTNVKSCMQSYNSHVGIYLPLEDSHR